MSSLRFQNPVEQLAAKLTSFDIPEAVLRKANERLRVVDVRAKTGSLGKAFDRQDARAAIILEYVFRKETSNRIPLKTLAKAAGVKEAKLKELEGKLMNYMNAPPMTGAAARSTRMPTAAAEGTSVRTLRRNSVEPLLAAAQHATGPSPGSKLLAEQPPVFRESILPELAIRLVSKLRDPNGCVQAAQKLLDRIHRHVQTSSDRTTHAQLHDLQRFAIAYQAAAFYYFANRHQEQQSGERKGKAAKGKSARRDADEANDLLDFDDLTSACNYVTLSELKQALPKIEKWLEQLDGPASKTDATDAASKTKKKQASATDNGMSKKRPRGSSSNATPAEFLGEGTSLNLDIYEVEETVSPESLREQRRVSSEQWRKDVLANAIQQAKQSLSADKDHMADENTIAISDEACLEYAADQIFARYELS